MRCNPRALDENCPLDDGTLLLAQVAGRFDVRCMNDDCTYSSCGHVTKHEAIQAVRNEIAGYNWEPPVDHSALEAEAAYYDQLAQEQAAAPQPQRTFTMEPKTHHLALARDYINQYEHRINQDNFYGNFEDRLRYEDAAYKQAIMHAAYAQADAATRQAVALESLCEYAGELIGAADLVNALMQWSFRQRAG